MQAIYAVATLHHNTMQDDCIEGEHAEQEKYTLLLMYCCWRIFQQVVGADLVNLHGRE